ncbi:MAG: PIN domain-containing protein [Oxalobacteraceae bacterium]|nr:PIN domain-containing protein [Oxalobacteraceae bacterium]
MSTVGIPALQGGEDVNDMEAGYLMSKLFQLPMQFAIPDILYWEEIEPGAPGLEQQGLRVLEVTGEFVSYASGLPTKYGAEPSTNDYLALALAKQEGCPLLTGDQALRQAAQSEDVSVMGSVWLLRVMVENKLLNVDQALAALGLMKERKRRLPWAEAERVLNGLRGIQ